MQNIPSTFYRVSVKALVFDKQGRFLLTKEKNGGWDFAGGGLDHGEEYSLGLAREIQEEMSINVTEISKSPSYFFTFKTTRGMWFANVLYEAKLENLDFTASDECIEIGFFTKEEALKENIFNNVKKFLSIYDSARHLV